MAHFSLVQQPHMLQCWKMNHAVCLAKVMMFRLFGEKCVAFSEEETRRESLLGAWHRVQWKFLRKHKVLNLKEHKMTPGYCWSGTTAPGSKYKLHCLPLNGSHLLFAY